MNNTTRVQFVKSFSKGQITIPKPIRNDLGIGEDFWLKLYVEGGKIVGEPMERQGQKKLSREEYIKKLISLKTDWFNPQEIVEMRKKTAMRMRSLDRDLTKISSPGTKE